MDTTATSPTRRKRRHAFVLFTALKDSGLLAQSQLDVVLQRLPEFDYNGLLDWLVDQGWLNRFQARRLEQGRASDLTFGQYRVLDELGEGGFGKVYKAVHSLMNRTAAIKVINPQWVQEADSRELFLREVVTTTRLNHPNIAAAYEANETDGTLWFAMEYIDGPTLHHYAALHHPLPQALVCVIGYQAAVALDYAASVGMIHRDVKPANILLAGVRKSPDAADPLKSLPPSFVKVVDFGLARIAAGSSGEAPRTLSQDGICLGTPECMSPEQIRTSRLVDVRSDLYSLGCTLYYALTAKYPFTGSLPIEVITKQLEDDPEPIFAQRPDVSPEVEAVVRKLMAKRPEDRYQSPRELMDALTEAMAVLRRPTAAPAPTPVIVFDDADRPADPTAPTVAAVVDTPVAPAAPPTPEPPVSVVSAAELRACRHEWLDLLRAAAAGRPIRADDAHYRMIHEALTYGLRHPPDGVDAGKAAEMAKLVSPWVNRRSLTSLDAQTLADLRRRCEAAEAALSPPAGGGVPGWLVGLLLAVAAAAGWWLLKR